MTIKLEEPVTKEQVQKALDLISKENPQKGLRKHFGKLKRGLNALDYQQKVRNEWSFSDC
jgi:hypothetical protein